MIKYEATLQEVRELSPLTLAYVGDAYFSLYIRTMLVASHREKPHNLHLLSNTFVKASAQRAMLEAISDILTDEEMAVCKRCRNAHSVSKAKNATVADYRKATAFEGVIGYLYLSGQSKRLDKLIEICIGEGKADDDSEPKKVKSDIDIEEN